MSVETTTIFLSESVNGEPIQVNFVTAITSVSRAVASNVATIVATSHGITTGATVFLSGMTDATYDGIHTVTATDANTLTFPLTHADESVEADSAGTVQPLTLIHEAQDTAVFWDEIEVYACNAGLEAALSLLVGEERITKIPTIAAVGVDVLVIPFTKLRKGLKVYAFADVTGVAMHGEVARQIN